MALLHLGMRWEDGTLAWKEEWLDKDVRDGRTAEDVTMVAMQQAADSILPWLQFTVDQPSNHGCAMVPVLDLQVWVKHPSPGTPEDQQHDVIGWCFYEKMTASNRVLRASSAYNWRNKLVTLNQEVFRRMRNCTRQLTVVARSDILKTYVAKLTLNRASAGIYARTVLYCTVLHCTVLYSTVQSLTFPQILCVRLCENLRVLGLV